LLQHWKWIGNEEPGNVKGKVLEHTLDHVNKLHEEVLAAITLNFIATYEMSQCKAKQCQTYCDA